VNQHCSTNLRKAKAQSSAVDYVDDDDDDDDAEEAR